MLKHSRAETTVGKLFQIDIDWHQRWAGVGRCIMRRPETKTPPTSAKFLEEIRNFLAMCKASIELRENPKTPRARDTYIMGHVLGSNMSRRKIDTVNKVRLYLQVENVAEISNPEGTKVDEAWTMAGPKPSWSNRKWPEIREPSRKMWNTLKAAIRIISQENGDLRQKLGRWFKVPAHRRYVWMQDGKSIYHENEGKIERHKIKPSTRGKATITSNHIPFIERSNESTPTYPRINGEVKIFQRAKVQTESKVQITEK